MEPPHSEPSHCLTRQLLKLSVSFPSQMNYLRMSLSLTTSIAYISYPSHGKEDPKRSREHQDSGPHLTCPYFPSFLPLASFKYQFLSPLSIPPHSHPLIQNLKIPSTPHQPTNPYFQHQHHQSTPHKISTLPPQTTSLFPL